MAFETGLIAYAGLAGLAASLPKQRRAMPVIDPLPPVALQISASALLCVSLLTAILESGGAIGVVSWAAQVSVSGAALVLLLSWRPHFAFGVAMATFICGLSIACM